LFWWGFEHKQARPVSEGAGEIACDRERAESGRRNEDRSEEEVEKTKKSWSTLPASVAGVEMADSFLPFSLFSFPRLLSTPVVAVQRVAKKGYGTSNLTKNKKPSADLFVFGFRSKNERNKRRRRRRRTTETFPPFPPYLRRNEADKLRNTLLDSLLGVLGYFCVSR